LRELYPQEHELYTDQTADEVCKLKPDDSIQTRNQKRQSISRRHLVLAIMEDNVRMEEGKE
jgi:hypothetical protein